MFFKSFSQTSCSLGDPVFVEDFGSGSSRLGPSLNQDPNADVHPNFRPASLYDYVGLGSVLWNQYGLMKNPKDADPNGAFWNTSFTDHTGDTNGYFYYCDAQNELKVFYSQKIDGLCSDIEYELSAWFANTNVEGWAGVDPNIKLIIGFTDSNDQNVGSIVQSDTGPIYNVGYYRWTRKALVFTVPPGAENIYFMLKNNISGTDGNDLAIDDIEVRPCGPKIDLKDVQSNNTVSDQEFCINDGNDTAIELSADIPNTFVMQWQESISPDVWTDISNETGSTLNITLPGSDTYHAYRLKFAHNPNNLLNTKCHFFTDPVTYFRAYSGTPQDMALCDDDNNGTMPFDLNSQDNAINPNSGYSISYHETQSDADSGINPLSSPYESADSTIYVRVENNIKPSCFVTTSFDLIVNARPMPTDDFNMKPLEACDDAADGSDTNGFTVFDLTQKSLEILNTQSALDFNITYFTDSGYTNEIINPETFTNSVSGGQTIFVRVTNNQLNSCYEDTSFPIAVLELPEANNPSQYSQCDDSSNDGQAVFNLTLDRIKEEINPDYSALGLLFTYYETQNDAEIQGTPINTPEAYEDAPGFNPETIWIRVENPSGCYRIVPLTIEVNPYSGALALYNPDSIYQCDDGVDVRDGIATFDLSAFKDHIENVVFSTFNATAHLYETQSDAELEVNEIVNLTDHQNVNSPNSQDIWVRITSDLNDDCLGLENFPDLLIVEALPLANPVSIDRMCDDDFDGAYPFDVSQVESTVLGTQSSTDVSLTYFDATGNPLLDFNGDPVTSPLPNTLLMDTQNITIRVTNNNTNDPDGPCYDETSLSFVVDKKPVANPVPDQVYCDGDAGDLDDDGKFAFDTSNFKSVILGSQTDMEVYYDDIDASNNVITHSSTIPNPLVSGSQVITAEVVNLINPNCTARTTINLTVNPLPEFTLDANQLVCSSDPNFTIVLDPTENDPNETFQYQWAFEDGTELGNSPTLTVSQPGAYFLTLTKTDGTLCSRTRSVYVNSSELATIRQEDVTIIENSDNNTISIDTSNLGLGDYEFNLDDAFGSYQNEPFFDHVRAGFHTIFVKDKNGCGIASLEISVLGYPKFFTPNNDGYNDYWQLKGLGIQLQANSIILIYDRYGKLLKQMSVSSNGWDGTFNGKPLIADDYWFKTQLNDGRTFTGHFALKR